MIRWLLVLLLQGLSAICWAQAKIEWFTPEVAQEIGIAVSTGHVPDYPATTYILKGGRVTAFTIAQFDTIATYAQGRIVHSRTHKPIKEATIQISFSCSSNGGASEIKTAVTNQAGFFRIGWVGCSGPEGSNSRRIVQIKAVGYSAIDTRQIGFGGSAYLHIELTAQ